MKYVIAAVTIFWLSIVAAFAGGTVPAVNTDMGCTTAGQAMYYTGSALGCGNPALSISAENIVGGIAPTIAAGSGAGTSPTVAVIGAQNSQTVSITTGTCTVACPASAVIATITFGGSVSCPTQATATITPANTTTAQLSGSGSIYPVAATTGYTLNSSATGLVASTSYKWNVHVDCW